MTLAERYRGRCSGGPYDDQWLEWDSKRYPIVISCSTAEKTAEQWHLYSEAARKYSDTEYVWIDSTWVWRGR